MTDIFDNIKNSLSLFVVTNGRSSFQYANRSVEEQTIKVPIHIIRDLPILQVMKTILNTCTTPYFMKVDDDFLLHKRGVEYMWSFLKSHESPMVAMYWWHLWENWSGNRIQSIKIYNKENTSKVGFLPDRQGRIDITFIGRVRKAGFGIVKEGSMPAIHGCSPWKEQARYLQIWKRNAPGRVHMKIRLKQMSRYKKPLAKQFSEKDLILNAQNKRFKTNFGKFLGLWI